MRFVRRQAPGAGPSRLRWVAAPTAGLLGLTLLSGCTSHTSAGGTPPSSPVGRPAPSGSASHAPASAPATTAPGSDTGSASSGWTIYQNQRYGFSAQIPASLTAGPSPNGGEGSTYRSAATSPTRMWT